MLDSASVRKGLGVCSACRIIKAQADRSKRAREKEEQEIENRADQAAARITLAEFERQQQAKFAVDDQEAKIVILNENIPVEEA